MSKTIHIDKDLFESLEYLRVTHEASWSVRDCHLFPYLPDSNWNRQIILNMVNIQRSASDFHKTIMVYIYQTCATTVQSMTPET